MLRVLKSLIIIFCLIDYPCKASCTNLSGTFSCFCNAGFVGSGVECRKITTSTSSSTKTTTTTETTTTSASTTVKQTKFTTTVAATTMTIVPTSTPMTVQSSAQTSTSTSLSTSTTTTTKITTTSTILSQSKMQTPNKPSILVLNTKSLSNKPLLIDSNGELNEYLSFQNHAHVYGACSLTWKNEHYVFGGRIKKTQISKIVKCSLQPIGHLRAMGTFPHYHGGCANMNDQYIYLCFSSEHKQDIRKCHVANNPGKGDFFERYLNSKLILTRIFKTAFSKRFY